MKKDTKILISGGGIGGCTLAYFLQKNGFSPVVIDSAPVFRRIGYLLALNAQIGQKVAQKMELLGSLKEFEVPLTNNVMYDTHGRQLLRFELDRKTLNERVGLMLNRADLHLALYSLIKDAVEFRMGQAIASATPADDSVEVTFTNGQQENFGVVIGADGIHSKVRQVCFGQGFESFMGYAYFAFMVPDPATAAQLEEHTLKIIRGDGFTIGYHRLKNDEIGAYLFHKEKTVEKIHPAGSRDHMLTQYGRYDATFKAILEGMKEKESVFHDAFTQIVMPSWHKGRVCLIGDAAFCPTPASGVGASMAMAAAYIVAKNLTEFDHERAFADYDAYMRPYIKKAQSSAARMLLLAAGGSIGSYEFTNFLLRLIPGGFVGQLHSHAIEMPLP